MNVTTIYMAMEKRASEIPENGIGMTKEAGLGWLTNFLKRFKLLTAGGRQNAYLDHLRKAFAKPYAASADRLKVLDSKFYDTVLDPGLKDVDLWNKVHSLYSNNSNYMKNIEKTLVNKGVAIDPKNPMNLNVFSKDKLQAAADKMLAPQVKALKQQIGMGAAGTAGLAGMAYGMSPDKPAPPPSAYQQFKNWLSNTFA